VRKAVFIRLSIALAAGLVFAVLFGELAYALQGNTTSRPPRTVELVIPPGTSDKVAQGQSVLPQDMVFVVGDTLVVHNQDAVAHSLGPLYIPAGTSASLALDHLGNLSFVCSFQPTKYLGLDIQEALTPGIRIEGIVIVAVPVGILLALYSLIVWPVNKNNQGRPGIS
jgi:hypothetical protein